jgi:hypothetical protein
LTALSNDDLPPLTGAQTAIKQAQANIASTISKAVAVTSSSLMAAVMSSRYLCGS